MQSIPLQAIPSQSVKAVLGNQNVQIFLTQRDSGIYADINSNGVDMVTSVICRDAVPIIARDYAGFSGNLLFIDTQSNDDPFYSGLGVRFQLVYFTDIEYALI